MNFMFHVLNDNDMSISRNVGRMSINLSKKRIKRSHQTIKKFIPKFIIKLNKKTIASIKTFLYGNNSIIVVILKANSPW